MLFYPKHNQNPPSRPGPPENRFKQNFQIRVVITGVMLAIIVPGIMTWMKSPVRPLPVVRLAPGQSPEQLTYVTPPQTTVGQILAPPVRVPTLTPTSPIPDFFKDRTEIPGSMPSSPAAAEDCSRQAEAHGIHLRTNNWRQVMLPPGGHTELWATNDMIFHICHAEQSLLHQVYRSKIDCIPDKGTCSDASGTFLPDVKPHNGTNEDPIVAVYVQNTSSEAHPVDVIKRPKD